jgi:hypothetical protein
MSITLSRIQYTNIGSKSSALAAFLDTLSPDETPTRLHLSSDDGYRILKLRDYAERNPDDASLIEIILDKVSASGDIDIVWG